VKWAPPETLCAISQLYNQFRLTNALGSFFYQQVRGSLLAALDAVQAHARSCGVSIVVDDAGAGLRKTVPPGDEVRSLLPCIAGFHCAQHAPVCKVAAGESRAHD
jgi:hypothetical protein